ncbi:MAG TPA: NADH-quinone oxidoreductase subunit M [Ignavibacteriales bacterium]|nr:NADH-quinone oxidoreductase subunit M [Ignavibacteriales bacterium]
MILLWLVIILMAGGIAAWIAAKWNVMAARWISLIATLVDFVLAIIIWVEHPSGITLGANAPWLVDFRWNWIPSFGISFHMAIDGLSLLLVLLTMFIGVLSVLTSWTEIEYRAGFFHFNLLWILAGITGVFLSLDLFMFYFFWEVMLIPMYFLIGIWGHENRIYASFKFFIFTQASSLFMLVAIVALYFIHGKNTGVYTFDYLQLLGTALPPAAEMWLMFGFLIAFVVKLPIVPLHNWLPDAHTEAPTAGSVVLAALLLKTGAYGILRFVIPLFPNAVRDFQVPGMILGAIGIIYGAILAFAQTDFKRLVAYTSVNHMGFVMLGAFALNELALQGVVMQMLCHGISTGALFILVGALYERIHTRDLNKMGGFWDQIPRMGGVGLVFALASLGLPGLGNFIAEFLILAGSYMANNWVTAVATLGLVASTIYSLRIMARVFYGRKPKIEKHIPDFNVREMIIMGSLIAAIVWLGVFPHPVLDTSRPAINNIINTTSQSSSMSNLKKPLLPVKTGTTVQLAGKSEKGGAR